MLSDISIARLQNFLKRPQLASWMGGCNNAIEAYAENKTGGTTTSCG